MCQHRAEVPKVETGIERHWREIEEADNLARIRLLAEALRGAQRPVAAQISAQMQSFGYGMPNAYDGIRFNAGGHGSLFEAAFGRWL